MLSKQEYEEIKQKTEQYVNDVFIVESMRTGAECLAGYIMKLLERKYMQQKETETAETGIDCNVLNKALKEGTIRLIWSMGGGVAFVPAEQKTDHDTMFENVLNNAEKTMQEVKEEFYFKEGGKHCGILTGMALEKANRIQNLMKEHNRGCYIKPEETEKEQWERLDGHQRCMKSASDIAYEEQNKGRILKSGSLSIRKNENGRYEYVSETQSDVDAGTAWDVLERLERLEKKVSEQSQTSFWNMEMLACSISCKTISRN